MIIEDSILKSDERIALTLRALYSKNGYSQFKMSKFEEYDLYMKNKDFLISDGIITFNDTNGKLLALKPDVTLSIVKNSKDAPKTVSKVYYNENVYRISQSSHTYREIMQTGLECIGDFGEEDTAEVVRLALESTASVSREFRMNISHVGFVDIFLSDIGVKANSPLAEAFFSKKNDEMEKTSTQDQLRALKALSVRYSSAAEAAEALMPICKSEESKAALSEFASLWNKIFEDGANEYCSVDFTVSNSTGYYSGIVFKSYISGIATPVLSGGQYDGLMKKLGRESHAIGFAVYLDALERIEEIPEDDGFINIALPKGRLGEKVYDMFEKAGYECPSIKEQNRKLIFENREKKIRYFWVKPSDVAIYVERGAADIGVAGYDILLEYSPDVYELCDLGIGKCRMAVAAKKDFRDDGTKTLRVATKFSNIAAKYYAEKCRDIDIIHLNGSIEIAPILGLSDVIVDIVETGKTLYENDLEPKEDIVDISARLISNKSSYQFKKKTVDEITKYMGEIVK